MRVSAQGTALRLSADANETPALRLPPEGGGPAFRSQPSG